ncbi:hypothetical protein QZH41_000160 [Actinostola sp. cb2023]|nr:hypothetical protein QZH41_000160 [Actinostola sp. cb2023]
MLYLRSYRMERDVLDVNGDNHLSNSKQCPARDRECKKCHSKGHFAVCCKTKPKPAGSEKAYQVFDEKQASGYAFTVERRDLPRQDGQVDVNIGGVLVPNVLIDSGASCNILDEGTWVTLKQQGVKCQSRRSEKKLFAFGQSEPLEVLGTFVSDIICSGSRVKDEFTVVRGKGRNLLGRTTAEKLNILRVGPPDIKELNTLGSEPDIYKQFPELFTGVGKLKDFKLKLHVNDKIKPVAQPVRRLPFALRNKVDEKLDELLSLDIIEEVPKGPTGWVSPLVVAPKPDGDIRVCVDMRRANEAIERERHPIPTIEEILYDLNGATVFSKLDLKWGFHQIELDEVSRHITTFVTHRGLYQYKRLMFGVTSAPEIYQKVISDVLQGCEGAANMADDIIVYGAGMEDHDKNLYKVLHRLKGSGMTLNKAKCQLRLPKLTYFGHELSRRGVSSSEEKIAAVVNARPPQKHLRSKVIRTTSTILVKVYTRLCPSCRSIEEADSQGPAIHMG